MKSRSRKRVVWNKSTPDAQVERALHQRQYIADIILPEEKHETYMSHLTPGSMWRVAATYIIPQLLPPDIEPPPHPYCVSHDWIPWGVKSSHQRGTIAVYLGTTRVEEITNSRKVSALRHTFMIEGSVYLTRNLSDWEPVS